MTLEGVKRAARDRAANDKRARRQHAHAVARKGGELDGTRVTFEAAHRRSCMRTWLALEQSRCRNLPLEGSFFRAAEAGKPCRERAEQARLCPFLLEMCMHVLGLNFRLAPKEKASGDASGPEVFERI